MTFYTPHLVQILGSSPKGNSGRSMKPCLPASGVWKASGWMKRYGLRPAASSPAFIFRTHSRDTNGSKWQLMPTENNGDHTLVILSTGFRKILQFG